MFSVEGLRLCEWVGGRTQHQHCQTACSAATHINHPIIYLSWVLIFGKRLF